MSKSIHIEKKVLIQIVVSCSIFLLILLTLPSVTLAANLIPCDGVNTPCEACHVVQMGQNVLNWIITIMVSVIGLVFVFGGMQMVMSGGNTEAMKSGRHKMINALVGFMIILAAWLIIDTFMKVVIVNPAVKQQLGAWNTIQCVKQPTMKEFTLQEVDQILAENQVTRQNGILMDGQLAHGDALSRLQGITVVGTGGRVQQSCAGVTGCTSLQGIREQTILQALNVKSACNCSVVVTGGTEPGHSGGTYSHGTGYKIDLDDNPNLDRFLQGRLIKAPSNRGGDHGGPTYFDRCGNVYVRESTHWDIQVSKGACIL